MGKAKAPKPPRECFYCGTVTADGQRDHFPKPKAANGIEVVWACMWCHNLKDRYRPTDLVEGVFKEPIEEWVASDQVALILLTALLPTTVPAEWRWDGDPTTEIMVLFDMAPNAMSRVYVARVMRMWWQLIAYGKAVCFDEDDQIVDRRAEWCGIEAAA